MSDRIIDWASGIGSWAYLAIFLVVSLESAAFLGFFMPGEAIVFWAVFSPRPREAASGPETADSRWWPRRRSWAIASATNWAGSCRNRGLRYGRWLGLREAHWQRLEDFFQRHGGKTVFSPASRPSSASWSRFLPGPCGCATFTFCCSTSWAASSGRPAPSAGLFGRRELAGPGPLDRPRGGGFSAGGNRDRALDTLRSTAW